MKKSLLAMLGLALFACSANTDDASDEGASDDDGVESSNLSVKGRWQPGAAELAAGMKQSVDYDNAPAWDGGANCSGGFTAGAKDLKALLLKTFPSQVSEVQGYNCRQIRGSSGMSLHGTGRAIDVFIPTIGGKADNTKGDKVAAFLMRNAEKLGVQFFIWDRSKWKPGQEDEAYGGQADHFDHLHVEITVEASKRNAPFYQGEKLDMGGGSAPSPTPQPIPSPSTSGSSGETCFSTTLKKDIMDQGCVQSTANDLWYICESGTWSQTTDRDPNCKERHAR
jgi:hypothetical protein